jgi:hypothetical protein
MVRTLLTCVSALVLSTCVTHARVWRYGIASLHHKQLRRRTDGFDPMQPLFCR